MKPFSITGLSATMEPEVTAFIVHADRVDLILTDADQGFDRLTIEIPEEVLKNAFNLFMDANV